MDIPHRGARPSMALLPAIRVHDSNSPDRFRPSSRFSSFSATSSPPSTSVPMPIPNARESVPPPLPPPRYLPDLAAGGSNGDIAWKWGNSHAGNGDWGQPTPSVTPGSSLHGSARKLNVMDERPELPRRGSSTSTIKSASGGNVRENTYPRIDEGYASLSGTSIGSNKSVMYFTLHPVD